MNHQSITGEHVHTESTQTIICTPPHFIHVHTHQGHAPGVRIDLLHVPSPINTHGKEAPHAEQQEEEQGGPQGHKLLTLHQLGAWGGGGVVEKGELA